MELTGKITIIEPTESGIGMATGAPWVAKNVVVDFEDDGRDSHLALRFMGQEDVTKLTECQAGDTIRFKARFWVSGKQWTSPEGVQKTFRRNEVTCYDVEVVKMEGL